MFVLHVVQQPVRASDGDDFQFSEILAASSGSYTYSPTAPSAPETRICAPSFLMVPPAPLAIYMARRVRLFY